jgi:HPt (histidine-containing phosphotransfer) domain-containing protein
MIIDVERTLSAFANDEEIFFSVLEEFVTDFDNQKSKLISCIEKKQLDEIRISTHTIKGLAATFYSEELKSIAAASEAAAIDEKIDIVIDKKDQLIIKFEELCNEAKRILNER